jgi:hypothetical protein
MDRIFSFGQRDAVHNERLHAPESFRLNQSAEAGYLIGIIFCIQCSTAKNVLA